MEKKLKIVMLGQKHVLSNEGGVEKVVREISTRLVRLGCDVTCYDRRTKHVMNSEENLSTLSEYLIPLVKNGITLDDRQTNLHEPFYVDSKDGILAIYEEVDRNKYKPVLIFREDK